MGEEKIIWESIKEKKTANSNILVQVISRIVLILFSLKAACKKICHALEDIKELYIPAEIIYTCKFNLLIKITAKHRETHTNADVPRCRSKCIPKEIHGL